MCATIDEVDYPALVSLRWLQQAPLTRLFANAERAAAGAVATQNDLISIRPFNLGDALPMYEAARESMEQLRAWMTWYRADFSLAQAEAFVTQSARAWAHGEQYSFAIIDARDNVFLGSVGLNQLNSAHKFANVGYWVRNSAAGRGVATAAVRQVAAFGLRELKLHRLEFLIPTVNVGSQRVAQKVGAQFEGVLRRRLVISGHGHDAAMYALTQNDQPEN